MTTHPSWFFWRGPYTSSVGRMTGMLLPGGHISTKCVQCGRGIAVPDYTKPYEFYISKGNQWPDVLPTAELVVSERVASDLTQAGITSFQPHPVKVFLPNRPKLSLRGAPKYSLIISTPGVHVDPYASGRFGKVICKRCGAWTPHPRGDQLGSRGFQMVPGSHSGLDLFSAHEVKDRTFCSLRVIELARTHKWTSAMFLPADITVLHEGLWKGIPYLAKKWPPSEWYPPTPDHGKSVEEWVQQFVDASSKIVVSRSPAGIGCVDIIQQPGEPSVLDQRLLALLALRWIGAPAVPHLVSLLDQAHPNVRSDAAFELDQIADEHDLQYPPDLKARIVELYPHAKIAKW